MAVHLSDRNAEMRLLFAFHNAIGLKAMGYQFHRGLVGGIAVLSSEQVLGTWRCDGGRFDFSRNEGGCTTMRASSIDQAISQTIALATSQFTDRL